MGGQQATAKQGLSTSGRRQDTTSRDTSVVEEGLLMTWEQLVRMRAWGAACRHNWVDIMLGPRRQFQSGLSGFHVGLYRCLGRSGGAEIGGSAMTIGTEAGGLG